MKRLLTVVLLSMLSLTAFAQKKVAVWETKCSDNSLKNIQKTMVRGGMEASVGNATGYEVYDRSAFDVIMKEHGFERSGAVSDDEIKEMGKLAGVQYIIVPEAVVDGDDFYLIVKMLDVEKGKFGGVHQALCTPAAKDIYSACEKLGKELFGNTGSIGSTGVGTNRPAGGGDMQRGQNYTETAFGIDMRMVYVEGGTFTMGCTSDQGGECQSDESPTRQTTVSSFYIGMLEVTQGQWEKVMGTSIFQQQSKAGSTATYGTGADYPMYYVSWEEAKEFCTRLSRQTGKTYRLTYEAEWEYAARGGKKNEGTKYSGGWSIDDVAWYTSNSSSSTHPCGTKRPNALGIYDMSGNVIEWCEDWYGSQYLQYDNNNPKGASSGPNRVIRGGSKSYEAKGCRVTYRNKITPSGRYSDLGFRVVCVP